MQTNTDFQSPEIKQLLESTVSEYNEQVRRNGGWFCFRVSYAKNGDTVLSAVIAETQFLNGMTTPEEIIEYLRHRHSHWVHVENNYVREFLNQRKKEAPQKWL